jgi:hypothetical protein
LKTKKNIKKEGKELHSKQHQRDLLLLLLLVVLEESVGRAICSVDTHDIAWKLRKIKYMKNL